MMELNDLTAELYSPTRMNRDFGRNEQMESGIGVSNKFSREISDTLYIHQHNILFCLYY